jgi:hypothetical protein
MLFSVPLFTVTTYVEEPNSYNYGLSLIRELGAETEAGKLAFWDTIEIQKALEETPLMFIYIDPSVSYSEETYDKSKILEWTNKNFDIDLLRDTEKEFI